MTYLSIGMVGLDTSHAIAFTKLLNDPREKHHVRGGKVEVAFPGGSPDFPLSMSRLKKYTKEMQVEYGVRMTGSIEAVAEECDAILLESVDGGIHGSIAEDFLFIDKPFSLSTSDAIEMATLARYYQTSIMSSSALRFSENLQEGVSLKGKGADCYGPCEFLDEQPDYFWYGIHAIEMLYTILGTGASIVESISSDQHDLLIGRWKDGRIGTVRGNRIGNYQFGAVIHFEKGSVPVDASDSERPYYASLFEQVIGFFQDSISRVPVEEMIETIRFIEAANESKKNNKVMSLMDVGTY